MDKQKSRLNKDDYEITHIDGNSVELHNKMTDRFEVGLDFNKRQINIMSYSSLVEEGDWSINNIASIGMINSQSFSTEELKDILLGLQHVRNLFYHLEWDSNLKESKLFIEKLNMIDNLILKIKERK